MPERVDSVFDHFCVQCDGMHGRLVNTIGVALSIKERNARIIRNIESDVIMYYMGTTVHQFVEDDEMHERLINTIDVALSIKSRGAHNKHTSKVTLTAHYKEITVR